MRNLIPALVLLALVLTPVETEARSTACGYDMAAYETLDQWGALDGIGYRLARCPLDDGSAFHKNEQGWRFPDDASNYWALANRLGLYLELLPGKKAPPRIPEMGFDIVDSWAGQDGQYRLIQIPSSLRYELQLQDAGGWTLPVSAVHTNPDGADRLRYWWGQIPPGKRP